MDIQDQERVVGSSGIGDFLVISLLSPHRSKEANKDRIIPAIGISFGVLPESTWKSDHLGLGACRSDRID